MSKPIHKKVIVTGGARRVGREIAIDLGKIGWEVAVHFNKSNKDAAEVVEKIEKAGGKAVAIHAKLDKEDGTKNLVEAATSSLGPINCLINNASVFEHDTLETVTTKGWDKHINTNLKAPLFLIKEFAKSLPNNLSGNVINLVDQRVWNLTPYFLSYTVSKVGLWTLTQSLALALAPYVRVNAIGPGPTLPSQRQTKTQFAQQCAATPLGRGTTPQEICNAVRFILSNESLTGQMIVLDGGQHLGWAQPKHNEVIPKE